jgi:hypothetical protein
MFVPRRDNFAEINRHANHRRAVIPFGRVAREVTQSRNFDRASGIKSMALEERE